MKLSSQAKRFNRRRYKTKAKPTKLTSGTGFLGPYGSTGHLTLHGSAARRLVMLLTFDSTSSSSSSVRDVQSGSPTPSYAHIGWARAQSGCTRSLKKVAIR